MTPETEDKILGWVAISVFVVIILGCFGVPCWAFVKIVNWICSFG